MRVRAQSCSSLGAFVMAAVTLVLLSCSSARAATDPNIPLLQPTSVAYDTAGNLFFAESRNHVVRRLGTDGTLTTVAGTSAQGSTGDNAGATSAQLNSPHGVALDAQGNLYIADTDNHRVRRVDAQTHRISTIAGTGEAAFSGDGAPATAATLRQPLALAFDTNNHLYIADSGNHRIRSIDLTTGIISTVVGSGRQGFSGEGGPAIAAALDSPSGLVLDSAGDLFIADSGNHRVREVSSATRQITTVAGATTPLRRPEGLNLDATGGLLIADAGSQAVFRLDLPSGTLSLIAGRGIQSFSGDQGSATLAMLDTPMGVALSPTTGALAIADSGNARIRLVSVSASGTTPTIATIAGLGTTIPQTLQLSAASAQAYGSATLIAHAVSNSTVTGSISLFLSSTGQPPQTLHAALSNGLAVFDLSALNAGSYQIYGVSSGDATHPSATSAITSLQIQPLAVQLLSTSWSMTYGSSPPVFSAQITGVLPRDQASVAVNSVISATGLPTTLAPGTYPVTFTLTGTAASNYALGGSPGQLTITKAPVQVTLQPTSTALEIAVSSTTSGAPTGAVTLLTSAGSTAATLPLQTNGTATVAFAGLTSGTYLLSAVYSGDTDFLAAQSSPVSITVSAAGSSTPSATADFALSSASSSSVSAPAGGSATFSLQVRPTGLPLSSPIMLTVSGLPNGATSGFSPSFIPPGSPASIVALTVQLPQTSARLRPTPDPSHSSRAGWACVSLATLLLCGLPAHRKPRSAAWRLLLWVLLATPFGLAGCGDRVFPTSSASAPQSYPLFVTATTTLANGSALQHTANLTLTVP